MGKRVNSSLSLFLSQTLKQPLISYETKIQYTMKQFNEQIEISIEVDAIAGQLRSMFKDDSANADIVVEQIIGRSLTTDKVLLGKLMSAMNGYQKKVHVEPGNTYSIKPISVYGYWTPESVEQNDTCRGDVTSVFVKEINPYSDNEVFIEFSVPKKDGTMKTETRWVPASQFSL